MLLNRFAKLKKAVPDGAVHTGAKQVLSLLRGTLDKSDLPAAVVEPATLDELARLMDFAGEKQLRVAIASGLEPVEVRGLQGHLLLLTQRFSSRPVFSDARQSIRVDAGLPVETLAVELASLGQRWLPLHPVPAGHSVGSLIASNWEGIRNWRDGGTAASIRAIEWMGYEGRLYVTGGSMPGTPDLTMLLCGSRGAYGVITSVELAVKPLPESRTLMLFQLPTPGKAIEALAWLRAVQPEPETVVYFNELATEILRSANDDTVNSSARVLIAAEWDSECGVPEELERYVRVEQDVQEVNTLWQDLFRLPKAAKRLSPDRTSARLKLPAGAIEDLEERARDLSRDFNLGVAMWGTVEGGHLHVWILQPDGEMRTMRQAGELLQKLLEDAIRLGGSLVDSSAALQLRDAGELRDRQTEELRKKLQQQCDPLSIHVPLRAS